MVYFILFYLVLIPLLFVLFCLLRPRPSYWHLFKLLCNQYLPRCLSLLNPVSWWTFVVSLHSTTRESVLRELARAGETTISSFNSLELIVRELIGVKLNFGTLPDFTPYFGWFSFLLAEDQEYAIKFVEDILLYVGRLSLSSTKREWSLDTITFLKARLGNKSMSHTVHQKCMEYWHQLGSEPRQESFETFLDGADGAVDTWDEIKYSLGFEKIHKFFMFCFSASLFERFGLTMDTLHFTELEQKIIRKNYPANSTSMLECFVKTSLFIARGSTRFFKYGDVSGFIHGSREYHQLYDDYTWVVSRADSFNSCGALDFTEPEFLSKMKKVQAGLKSALRYLERHKSPELKFFRGCSLKIDMISNKIISKESAQRPREHPFSLLIYGSPGIGKSTFVDVSRDFFAKTENLPPESRYQYVRSATSDFWDSFSEEQWCIVFDDIAFMEPNVAKSGGDPSTMEFISVINTIPFVPNQADLADKGVIPCRPKLVLGTTNTKHMNAKCYFSAPSAVQRRFPYVVTLVVNKAYATAHGLLDSSKTTPGMIPDYWDISVDKVLLNPLIPSVVTYKPILVNIKMQEFLRWYRSAIQDHNRDLDVMRSSRCTLLEAPLCKWCGEYKVQCSCLVDSSQSLVVSQEASFTTSSESEADSQDGDDVTEFQPEGVGNLFDHLPRCGSMIHFMNRVAAGLVFHLYLNFIEFASNLPSLNFCIPTIVWVVDGSWNKYMERSGRWHFGLVGKRVESYSRPGFAILCIIAILGVLALALELRDRGKKKVPNQEGQISTIGGFPKVVDEGECKNVWYQPEIPHSELVVEKPSTSITTDDLARLIEDNTAYAVFSLDGKRGRISRLFRIGGTDWITTNHSVPEGDVKMVIRFKPQGTHNGCHTFHLSRTQVSRDVVNDLAMIRLPQLPPGRDMLRYFCSESLRFKGAAILIHRDASHKVGRVPINVLDYGPSKFATTSQAFDVWKCTSSLNTANGVCGSPIMGKSPLGNVILGVHCGSLNEEFPEFSVAGKYKTFAHRITRERVEKLRLTSFLPQSANAFFRDPSIPTVKVEVAPLHKKSAIRFIPDAEATVYGSLSTGRARPRSRVVPTPMHTHIVAHGHINTHGAPVMRDYRPWRLALVDMTNPVSKLDVGIVKECADAFLADILRDLPPGELDLMEIYNHDVTINGSAGTTFVDAMKRNTSAGYPWCHTKRLHLSPLPDADPSTHKMTLDDEVMTHVEDMRQVYLTGERASAIFTAHLKDEAVSLKKIDTGKTRVFCGATLPYSYLMRQYLLSAVRVLQRNRFVFEAMPGTIAQSKEWGEIFEYLTFFGDDRIVAGDYKAFDKRMPAVIITFAFDILYGLCEASGNYSSEDLRVICGLATDTAYPMVNFNGDLLEFLGSNPSGHPLTVIINSLANSLYMRYCYYLLNPEREVESFKRNVHLATYGDDNIMGSREDWFNHTSISELLASVDITYTMADKTSESVPFISIQKASFLKRTWEWSDDVGMFLCPLNQESIMKSMMHYIPSREVSEKEQLASILYSAYREYFFHGGKIRTDGYALVKELARVFDLEEFIPSGRFPTDEEMSEAFRQGGRA